MYFRAILKQASETLSRGGANRGKKNTESDRLIYANKDCIGCNETREIRYAIAKPTGDDTPRRLA